MNNFSEDALKAGEAQISKRLAVTLAAVCCAVFFLVAYTSANPPWWFCGDEGFFTVAARNVWRGMRPYRDFLFLQMPLMPYVYAPWYAMFGFSIEAGKILGALFATASVALTVAACYRLAGFWSAAIAGFLWLSSIHVAYDLSAVKTLSLCNLFVSLAIFSLSRAAEPLSIAWLVAAMACFSLAFLTRLTFVLPLIFVWLCMAWLLRRHRNTCLFLLFANLVVLGFVLAFFWSDGKMWFGVYTTHSQLYGAAPWTWSRLFWTIKGWLGNQMMIALFLAAAAVRFVLDGTKQPNPQNVWLPGFLLASYVGVTFAHWSQVQNYPTHQSAITSFAIVFSALVLGRPFKALAEQSLGWALATLLLAAAIFAPFTEVDLSMLQRASRKADPFAEALSVIGRYAKPGDQILSFNVELPVMGGYEVFEGCDMSEWGYVSTAPDDVAKRYHLLNKNRLMEAIREAEPPILTMTDRDFAVMAAGDPKIAGDIKRAIDAKYQNVGVVKHYGQFGQDLFIFKRL